MHKYPLTLLVAVMLFLSGIAQTTAKEWYDKGISLKTNEDYKGAITAFKQAVSLKSDYVEALHQLGWCYNEQDDYTSAVEALLKEYNAGPADKAANCFELGYAYEQLAKYDDALTYINSAIEADNNYALAYKERGMIYYKTKKYEAAIADFAKFEAASEEDIDDPDYYFKKGWMQNEQKKYDDALKSLKKAVSLDDPPTDAFVELGYTNYKLKLNDDALKNYRIAMTLDANNHTAIFGMADVFYDNTKIDDSSIYYYQKGLQLKPGNKTAWYHIGWCYNNKDKFEDAINPLQKAIGLDANYLDAKKELAYSYYKLKRLDEALAIFEPIMNNNSSDELSRYYAGFCYYLKNNQDSLKKMIAELKALNSTRYVETLTRYVKQ